MICCVVSFAIIVKFVYGVSLLEDILGLRKDDYSDYDEQEYCELDEYKD